MNLLPLLKQRKMAVINNCTMNIAVILFFFGMSGVMGYLTMNQKKKADHVAKMPELDLALVKGGEVGIVKGTVQGTAVKLPYVNNPVAYFEYQLDEQMVKEVNGQKRRSWKRVKGGKSRQPILVQNESGKILVNPSDFAMKPIKLYDGEAIGLNQDIFEAIQFLAEGQLRPDLMTKKLKLKLYGLPIGQNALVAGTVQNDGNAFSMTRGVQGSVFAPTHNVAEVVKKEKMMTFVFAGLALLFIAIGVYTIIAG